MIMMLSLEVAIVKNKTEFIYREILMFYKNENEI